VRRDGNATLVVAAAIQGGYAAGGGANWCSA